MEPFIGQIVMFGGNFAPRSWALCDGQLLPINSNSALFSILGTTYGGDGRSTFGLPDLRGRSPIHAGNGPGLTPRALGAKGGAEHTTLTVNNLPPHNHALMAAEDADTDSSDGTVIANHDENSFSDVTTSLHAMNAKSVGFTGSGVPANNMQPYQAVNYIIALQGTYPSRN